MRLASTCILLVGKAKAEECSFRITQNSNTNNDLSEERKKQAAYRQIINVVVLMSDGSACVCNSQQCIRFYLLCSQQHSTVQHSISYTLRECVFVNKLYVWSEKKIISNEKTTKYYRVYQFNASISVRMSIIIQIVIYFCCINNIFFDKSWGEREQADIIQCLVEFLIFSIFFPSLFNANFIESIRLNR